MNVLLTCAGRRQYLVQYFRDALGKTGAIYAADCNPQAPAMLAADAAFVLPPVNSPRYRERLFSLCREHEVRLLLPLSDLELPMVAAWRSHLLQAGTIPVVASPDTVDICEDKWRTYQFLMAHGLAAPRTYCTLEEAREALSRGDLACPLVVKPRWGSASRWLESCADAQELELVHRLVRRRVERDLLAAGRQEDPGRCVLVQQRLGGDEYGLDVVNDLAGRCVCSLARRKLMMRAGETDRAVTVEDGQLSELGRKLGTLLGHVGDLDCDVFLAEGRPQIVDMNPRFGGGYPFSHVAGANLPAALLAWAANLEPDPRWFTVVPGVMSVKCDQLLVRELPAAAPETGAAGTAAE